MLQDKGLALAPAAHGHLVLHSLLSTWELGFSRKPLKLLDAAEQEYRRYTSFVSVADKIP